MSSISIPALREKIIKHQLNDSWWLAVDDVPEQRPLRLRTIEETIRQQPDCEYQILHVDQVAQGDTNWQKLYLMPRLRKETPQPAVPVTADISSLLSRIDEMEANQQKLIEAVARLSDLLERAIAGREVYSDDAEDNGILSKPDGPMSKNEQLRAKMGNGGIRLVG